MSSEVKEEFKPEVRLPKGGWRLGQHKTVNSDTFYPSVLDDQGRLLATFYGSNAERNARLFVIAPEMVKNLIELELAFSGASKEAVEKESQGLTAETPNSASPTESAVSEEAKPTCDTASKV